MARLEVDSYTYAEALIPALSDFMLVLGEGDRYRLHGPSPSGKSTVLGLLSQALPRQWGGIFRGKLNFGPSVTRDVAGTVPLHAVGSLLELPGERWTGFLETCREELALDALGRGMARAEISPRMGRVTELLGVASLLERNPRHLSGGEQQRMSLASALMAPAPLFLLDDPLMHVDMSAAAAARAAAGHLLPQEAAVVETSDEASVGLLDRPESRELGTRLAASATRSDARLQPVPARDLTVRVRRAGYVERPDVLRDLEFTLHAGEVVGLAGPNGAGKSTLFASIMGLLECWQGECLLDGVPDYERLAAGERAAFVGLALQQPHHQFFKHSVRAELLYGPHRIGRLTCVGEERVLEELEAFLPLGHLYARHPRGLSRGETRRLGLACVLAMDCGILLLDEPTASLDRAGRHAVQQYVTAHAARGGAALLASHDRIWLESACSRIITIGR